MTILIAAAVMMKQIVSTTISFIGHNYEYKITKEVI